MAITVFRQWTSAAMIAVATGCGPHASPPQVPKPHTLDASTPLYEYQLGDEGLYASFPVEPVEQRQVRRGTGRDDGGEVVALRAWIATKDRRSLGCAVIRAEGLPGALPASWRGKMFAGFFKGRVQTSPAPPLGDYTGERFVGTSPEGNARTGIAYLLRDGLLMVWMDGTETHPDLASRFFASLRIAPAWQIRATPTLGIAVAVPALADEEMRSPYQVDFVVGGNDAVMYSVAVSRMPDASTPATAPDDVKPPEGNVTSSARIEHDGLPGREWNVTHGKAYLRRRVLATESRLYSVSIVAGSPGRTVDSDAQRFLDSMRIF